MATEAFLKAARAANKKPVVLLAVESISAVTAYCSTQADWQAAKAASGVNVAASQSLGSVILATDDPHQQYSGVYTSPPIAVSPAAQYILDGGYTLSSTSWSAVTTGMDVSFGSNPAFSATLELWGRRDGGEWQLLASVTSEDFDSVFAVRGLVRGSWETRLKYVHGSGWLGYNSHTDIYEVRYVSSGTIQTPTIDLGLVPAAPSRLEIDQIIPSSGCGLSYTARGSNDGAAWTELGAVVDGSVLPPYRYYDVTASFISDGISTPELKEIRISGGDSQFEYFSTHRNLPVKGAKPYIVAGGVNSLTSKIDLLKPTTTGEVSVKLLWRKKTGDLIATGYLKNKTCIVKHGFVGLAEADYETFFTGTFYDHEDDHENRTITVKLRDVWKKLQVKIPPETQTGTSSTESIVYRTGGGTEATPVNLVQEMLNLISIAGVPDRYVDRAAFQALRDGALSGSGWNVTRTLTSSTSLADLINELAVSAGIFLVPLPSGRLTPIYYPAAAAAAPVAVLDAAKTGRFQPLSGGQGELTTQTHFYYQLLPGKNGGSKEDYAQIYWYVNGDAEVDWQESQAREWLDKWGLSMEALQRLAQRFDGWFANPRYRTKVTQVPYRYNDVLPGMVLAVNNLPMPCPAADWEGYTVNKRFLVMSRTDDPNTLTLSFDLFEIDGDTDFAPDPGVPEYSRFSEFPPVADLTLTERIELKPGGGVDVFIDVTFATPADMHFGAAEVWWKTTGGWKLAVSIPNGGPDAARSYPLVVSAGLSYTVAVVTVNAAGVRMPIAKAPTAVIAVQPEVPPAPVTNLTADVIDNNVILRWRESVPGTFPVHHYEVRRGTNQATADVVYTAIGGTFAPIMELAADTYKYWVIPVSTSGLTGAAVGIYAQVTQPPDYVLHDRQDLDLATAVLTNAVLDQDGTLLMPVNITESWQQHFDNQGFTSPQQQVDAGKPLFLQPGPAAASAEWVIDYGGIIAATTITLTVTRTTLAGDIVVTPTLSVSATGAAGSWTDYAGVYQAYGLNFRYLKVRLGVAAANNGLVQVQQGTVTLAIKEKNIGFKVNILDTAGDGTRVNFTDLGISPLDVRAIVPAAPYLGDATKDPVKVLYNFVDAPNPTFAKFLAYDKNGNRITLNNASIIMRYV